MVNFNPVDEGYYCQVTNWPSKYKQNHTSCLWQTLSHKQSTERGGDFSFAELCIDQVCHVCNIYSPNISLIFYCPAGNVYNIPICIWLMDSHPYNPPMVYVKPTATMQIKAGRNVDMNGKIDLPYLREWKYVSFLSGNMALISWH